jgi:YggT family protein
MLMGMLIYLITLAINIYIGVIVLQVAVSWLIAFEVINANNEQARNLIDLLKRLTDPVYQPLKKYIPPIGGIDITPLIVIILLSILQNLIVKALLF